MVKDAAYLLHSWRFPDLLAAPSKRHSVSLLGWVTREFQNFRGNVNGNQSRSGLGYGKHFAIATTRKLCFIFKTIVKHCCRLPLNGIYKQGWQWWISANTEIRNDSLVQWQNCDAAVTSWCDETMFAILIWTQLQLVSIIQIKCYLGGCLETRLVFQDWDLLFPDWWWLFLYSFNNLG